MSSKEELIKLIEEIPETQILQVSNFLKKITKTNEEPKVAVEALDPLDTFMATIVHSLTNTMYDLSLDAKRKEEKVMAKRLEVYRKKVSDGWETYKKTKVRNEHTKEL